jgi:hypothetical protein
LDESGSEIHKSIFQAHPIYVIPVSVQKPAVTIHKLILLKISAHKVNSLLRYELLFDESTYRILEVAAEHLLEGLEEI